MLPAQCRDPEIIAWNGFSRLPELELGHNSSMLDYRGEWGKEKPALDAITIMQGVVGGIAGPGQKPPEPFKMIVDRPFLFFIRDNVTNTLLFSGAVMDPNPR